MNLRRASLRIRLAAIVALAAGIMLAGGCADDSGGAPVDPGSLGFEQYYKCASDLDVVTIGKRANARECLAACKAVSSSFLGGTAKACWYLDGSAGYPQDCRLCMAAPAKDVFLNSWMLNLPAGK